MRNVKIPFVLGLLVCWITSLGTVQAGIASSTVFQNGLKVDFNQGAGSASKIGTFDFNFVDPLTLTYLKARIRLWAQLPPEAVGDLAPTIVFAKLGISNLDQALITGDAVRTDVRISFNLFESGIGVMQKQTDFENLTKQQGLALAAILASDSSTRLEAWLVSDTLKAITVPAYGEKLELINGFPEITLIPFTSTLDLQYVPEPSSNIIFASAGLFFIRRSWLSRRKRKAARIQEFGETCPS